MTKYIVETRCCRYAGNDRMWKFESIEEAISFAKKKQKKTKNTVAVFEVITIEERPRAYGDGTYTRYTAKMVFDAKEDKHITNSLNSSFDEY